MDTEKMIAQERKGIVYDALLCGLFIAAIGVECLTGTGWYTIVLAFFLGMQMKQIGNRIRAISWMELVQRQDAVIEQLLQQVERNEPPTVKNGRVDFV